MNMTKGCVLNPRKYTGDTIPPNVIEDISRYNTELAFGAGAAAPNWTWLPSGIWVLEYDGGDYASLNIARWRDWDVEGSIAGWIQTIYTAGSQTIFATSDTGGDVNFLQLRVVQTTGFLEIVQRDGGALNQITGDVACNDGVFHHCVVTGDMAAGAWILYVDGVIQGLTVTSGANTGNWFSAIFDIRDNLSVGAMLNTGIADYLVGLAPPPRVYSYVMTPAQIWDRFNKERGWYGR